MDWNKLSIAALLGIAILGVSCSREENAPEFFTRSVELCFADASTRPSLNSARTLIQWQNGDEVSIFNDVDNSSVKAIYSSESAMKIDVPDGTRNLYALYPFSADATGGAAAVPVCIPSIQTQSAPGVMNCGVYPLIASAPISEGKAVLSFSPAASALALVVYNTGLEGSENLLSVRVTPTSNTGFAGNAVLNLTGKASFTEGDSSASVTLSTGTPQALLSSKPESPKTYDGQLFVTLAKQSYKRVRFDITTDKKVYTIQSNDTPIDLGAYDIKILSIDLGKGRMYVEGSVSHEGFEEEGGDITEAGSFLESPVPVDRVLEDQDHDVIPDFSRVGYKYGDEAFPDYANVVSVPAPTGGDDSALIQSVIDSAPASSVVQLAAGTYKVSEIIFVDKDNMILRGSAEGTTIVSTSKYKQPVINFGKTVDNRKLTSETETVNYPHGETAEITTINVSVPSAVYSSSSSIVEDYVPFGRLYVKVSRPELFNVGDRVVIYRPATANWIHDIKMDQIPNHDGKQVQWTPSGYGINWERMVTDVVDDRVYLDNPVVMALDINYGGGMLKKMSREKLYNSGIENLTLDCEFDDSINGAPYYNLCDESHAWWGIRIRCAEHCWVKGITTRHMGYSCVEIGAGSKNVTVDDCHSLSPISMVDGSRRYAFQFVTSTACLYSNCTCEADRHQFVTTARNPGPDVFYNCTATSSLNEAGPHQRWATGVLYDNVVVDGDLEVVDGEWCGSGHGWRGANFVFWNCTAGRLALQSPWVSAKNYCVGGIGEKIASTRGYQTLVGQRYDGEWFPAREIGSTGGTKVMLPYNGSDKPDWFPVLTGTSYSHPESLYQSQLEERHSKGIYFNRLFR